VVPNKVESIRRSPRRSKREFHFAPPEAPPGCSSQIGTLTRAALNAAVCEFFAKNRARTHLAATVSGDFAHPWYDYGPRLLLARHGFHWGGYVHTESAWLLLVSADQATLDFYSTPRDNEIAKFAYERLGPQATYCARLQLYRGGRGGFSPAGLELPNERAPWIGGSAARKENAPRQTRTAGRSRPESRCSARLAVAPWNGKSATRSALRHGVHRMLWSIANDHEDNTG
jgi:hypothetical protein